MIAELLDKLVKSYERQGVSIANTLNPGLDQDSILASYPAVDLCEEIIQMYMWRNGCPDGWNLDGLYFRDNGYLEIGEAIEQFKKLVPLYIHPDGLEQTDDKFTEIGFEKWVPFAGFNGVMYFVVCGEHIYGTDLPNPVVSIGAGELNIRYNSLTSMVKTCIDWVNHIDWENLIGLDDDVESEIWISNNPGILERRDRAFATTVETVEKYYSTR